MQYEKDLLSDQFPDCQHKRLECSDFIVNNYNSQQPYSAAISYNNEILVIGHYNSYTFIDLITRDSQLIIVNNTQTQKIITAIEISYYNHYIVLGTQIGDCYIQPILNSPKELTLGDAIFLPQLMPNTVRNIFTTSADFIILISISVIRITTHDQMIEGEMPCKEQIQPLGVTAAIYNYENDSLIVALGDSSIIIYDMKGLQFEELFTFKQKRLYINLDCYEIINKLTLSEDGRLLGVASCYLIGDEQYRVDIIDLTRKGKVIRKLKFDRANELRLFHFLPFLNFIFIIDSSKNIFVENFDIKQATQESELSTTYQEEIKITFLLSKVVPYPNILFITSQGMIQQISFLAEKTNQLYQLPYMYFVEAKLSQTLDYKSLMKYYFQSTLQSGLLETDTKQSVLLGESYFQPLFETVMRLSEFKKYFTSLYEERQKLKRRRYQLPLWIASWAFQAAYQKIQNFPPPPPLLLQNSHQGKKVKGNKVKQLNQLKMKYTVEFDNKDEEKKQLLQSFGINCNLILKQQEELQVMDDRFLIIYKLINNIEIKNLSMVMLQNCSILFDKRLKFINLMIETINQMDQINYLDLSYNNLTINDLRKINRLTQLKYLNIAGNNLGNIQKRKIKKINIQTDFDEKFEDNTTISFYELLFTQIEMINLRDNNYSDEEGVELMELLERSNGLRLLDVSGNSGFHKLTKDAVSEIIQGNKMKKQELSQLLMIEFNSDILEGAMKQLTNEYLKRFMEIPILYQKYVEKEAEKQELYFAQQDQIIEANKRKSIPKKVAKPQAKRKSLKKQKQQQVEVEEVDQEQIVSEFNSQQKYEWDYSLLTLYERSIENQEDEIRNCVFKMFYVCQMFFVHQYENIQANFLNCLNQIFCSIFFIQKYLVCCYCVFLTSRYGSWITSLLGIKTADYEYNDKKDQLQKYLENKKIWLNLFFWLNYLIFYTIVIFVPIKFVLKCEGHEWTGHLIFCGYAAASFFIEVLLSWICHKHNISHPEFETGPVWKRVMFFLKDTTLSLIARFDVYSDVCFITTVVECGDGNGIGIAAIIVMSFSICTTSYDVLKLLLSKQVGDQNYIDFLCNYCSFVEINLVSSLLEKWTIQNTSNFLCFKGLPNRIYAVTFRTFAEDIPQFFLQVIYLLMNPNKTEIEILMLSLASSTVSTLLSITKSVTITKANRINDKVMMNQVKTKLKLQKQVQDVKYNDTIIQFLHDYYEVFDGEEHQETANYGVIDFKLAKITRNKDVDKYRTVKEHKIRQYKLRGVSMLEEQKQIIKGMTKKLTNMDKELNIEEMFEPYAYYIHSFQDGLISKMWSEQVFTQEQIAKVLLELEMSQYINVNQITSEKQSYSFQRGGSFIECLKVQAIILDHFYTHVTKNQIQNLKILDLGCGYGYTTTAILKLIESNAYVCSFKFICIDHHQQILQQAENILKIGYDDLLQNKLIEFIQYDCKEDLQQFGQFDIIYVGFAIRDATMLKPLLQNQGIAIYPQIALPQDHDYYALIKTDDQFEPIDLNLQSQSGDFIPKELQDPELFQYFDVRRGSICKLCQKQLQLMQFYSPWLNQHYCLDCGQIDDEILEPTELKILSNLIFIPFNASENEMKKINAYKFGKNLFPQRDQRAVKYHAINCYPCQREIGDEEWYRAAPRYICLNCRSGKFDGQHLDFCHDCAKEFMEQTYQYQYKLESVPGHSCSHLLLKIHFYCGYNEY